MSRFFSLSGSKSKFAAVAAALAPVAIFAEDPITLPQTGVDIAGYATAAITALGAIVAVVVGGIIAYQLVRAGIRWIRSMK